MTSSLIKYDIHKLILPFICITAFAYSSYPQNLLQTKPAELQLVGETVDGKPVLVQSSQLIILYKPDGINVLGELPLNSLFTSDQVIQALVDASPFEQVTFETILPPERFVFGQVTEAAFSAEATLQAGDISFDFIIDFIISHNRIAETNTFLITGMGTFSLSGLGLMDLPEYQDTFRFQFRQNVISKKVG